MKIKTFVSSVVLLIIITVFSYGTIVDLFYQQDEWQTIGNNIILNNFFDLFKHTNLIQMISVQERFGSNTLSYFLMGVFAFNTKLMGVYSLFFHVMNVLLVYFIIRRWVIRDAVFSVSAALFFAVSEVSMSAVSWFGTSLGTLPAVTFILLSIVCYFKYVENNKPKWIFGTLLLLYLSFFFKEVGIFLLLFLPLALFILKPKREFYRYPLMAFLVVFLFVTIPRLVNLVFLSDRSGELFVTASEPNFVSTILSRAIVYPLTSFSLIFIPSEPFVLFAKHFTNIYYPFVPSEHFNLIAQTIVLDLFAVFMTCVVLFVVYVAFRKEDASTRRMLVFWVCFFLLSFMPYILLGKNYAYLESRYYYLSNLPAGILLGTLGLSLKKFLDRWRIGFLAILIMACFLTIHIKFLKDDLNRLVLISRERIEFFKHLSGIKPQLTKQKNVFYLAGDRDYYIPGNHVPFQQGMGYTFMVWYYSNGNIPKEFIRDRFLWDLNTQGYRETSNSGFGFFYNQKELEKTINEYALAKDEVIALYYDSKTKMLRLVSYEEMQ